MKLERWELGMNPILIKEMRQLVRSRYVVGLLMLFLMAMLFIGGGFLIVSEVEGSTQSTDFREGQTLFGIMVFILTFAAAGFVPLYTAIRFILEHSDNQTDLLFVSTISAAAIIRGKMLAAVVLTGLLFSACVPFMVLTYLLRGIDLPSIFVYLAWLFIGVIVVTQVMLLVATIPVSRIFKILLLVLAGIAFLFPGPGIMIGIGSSGSMTVGSSIGTWDFWQTNLLILMLLGVGTGLAHVLSIANVSPVSANKATPVRVYLTVVWLISGSVCLVVAAGGTEEPLEAWIVIMSMVIGILFLFCVGERADPSIRIRRAVPRNKLLRLFVFPFLTSPLSGVIWGMVWGGLTILVAMLVSESSWSVDDDIAPVMGLVLLYLAGYALLGAWLRRVALDRVIAPRFTWVVALTLVALGCVLPILGAFVTRQTMHGDFAAWYVGNIIDVGKDSRRFVHLAFAASMAAVGMIANVSWFKRQAAAMKPLAPRSDVS